MTYQQKMTRHLQLATKLNDEVDAMEQAALDKMGGRGAKVDNLIKALEVKRHFEHNELYRQKGNARNLHVQLAIMYGIATLVSERQ